MFSIPAPWPERLGIVSRALAAIVGGYALAALCSVALALLLPLARSEAVTWGMLASFAVYAGAALWAFAASTAARAWGGLALALAVAALPAALRWLGWMAPLSAGGGA